MENISIKQILKWGLAVLTLLLIPFLLTKSIVEVDAGEIVVVQSPITGTINIHFDPGWHGQNFGTVTVYHRSYQYWFDGKKGNADMIPVKFYDGGHASIPGSVRVDMPLSYEQMKAIHIKYRSEEAVRNQLIGQILQKSVYFSGPTMTSKQSFAEKKNDLLYYVEDQATKGIYRTQQKEVKIIDPLTGKERSAIAVEIIQDTVKSEPLRLERSLIAELGIGLNNLSFGDFVYDSIVKAQIATQQQGEMAVQTAIVEARKAEQDRITTEQTGMANAAAAKWAQEAIKATEVTQAEKNRDVAKLNMETESFNKQALTLKGEGEASYKRAVTQANDNLELRLNAYVEVTKAAFESMSESQWVPTTVIMGNGGSGGAGYPSGMALIDMLLVKTTQDLGLTKGVK